MADGDTGSLAGTPLPHPCGPEGVGPEATDGVYAEYKAEEGEGYLSMWVFVFEWTGGGADEAWETLAAAEEECNTGFHEFERGDQPYQVLRGLLVTDRQANMAYGAELPGTSQHEWSYNRFGNRVVVIWYGYDAFAPMPGGGSFPEVSDAVRIAIRDGAEALLA